VNVRFDVSPKDNEAMLAIKAGKKKVDISKDEEVQMQDGDEVSLDLVELDRKIREMKGEIERHAGASNQLNILKQQRASEEFDAAKGEAGI
jgi:TolA-binding protein